MYSLGSALGFLRREISRFEQEYEESETDWERNEIEETIEWYFERGLNLIQFAKPGEVNQKIIDYFLGRVKKRPERSD